MNGYISLIKFCDFSLIMRPFFVGDTEKMDKVEVVIRSGKPDKDISFILSDKIQDIAIPQEGEPKTVKGKMYLDSNKEKIIFEGLYRIGEDSSTFWLEVDPYSSCLRNQTESKFDPFSENLILKCEDYPLSVGAVAFNISPAVFSETAVKNVEPQAIAKLKKLSGEVYLHTILNQNNREIRGINTCLEDDKTGFVGDIGIFRDKVFIDGEMIEEGISNCYIYAEIGESFLLP